MHTITSTSPTTPPPLTLPTISAVPTATWLVFMWLLAWAAPLPAAALTRDATEVMRAEGQPTTETQKPPKKKEIRFAVKGNCGQCQRRIEASLDQKGIVFAEWIRDRQEVRVVYKPSVVTEEQLHTYIAAVGHDTALKKADKEVYKRLPQCCLYRDGGNLHE